MTERTALRRRRKLNEAGPDGCPPEVLEWWRAGCAEAAVPWGLLLAPTARSQGWIVQLRALLPGRALPPDLRWLLADAGETG